jgi:hypothetical protein
MKKLNIANRLHSISFRRIAKPLAICITALFMISMVSALSNNTVQAATTTSALHTSGHTILDANNNPVYLRGIGRAGDIDSLSGMWGGPGEDVFNYAQKFQTDTATLTQKMDQTLSCYQNVWKVNLIRVFVPVDWWWMDNVNPSQQYGQGPNQVFSYRNYIALIVQEAAKYGIYVDICPYGVLNYYAGNSAYEGIPGSLYDASLNYMHTINANEMTAWQMWWTSVANKLGQNNNVIFEMWNEPDDGSNTASSAEAAAYFNYMIQSYQAIRATGSQNIIFMQWHMGLVPTWTDFSWVPQLYNQLKSTINTAPINVAFTAHPYRHAPYPNLQWATTYSGVKAQLNDPGMIPATRSNGIDVPVVFNEMGVCMNAGYGTSDPLSNEYGFWSALLQNSYEMGVGVVPYYWMQTGAWGYDEALVQGTWAANAASPTPTQAGQAFIDAYVAPTQSTPTPTPTTSPTPSPSTAPTPTATPTSDPTETPTPAPTNSPTQEPTVTPTPTATSKPAPVQTQTPTPTRTPTATSKPTTPEQTSPTPTHPPIQHNNFFRHWYTIYWPHFNTWNAWFFFR